MKTCENGFFLVLAFDDIVVGYRIAVPAADSSKGV